MGTVSWWKRKPDDIPSTDNEGEGPDVRSTMTPTQSDTPPATQEQFEEWLADMHPRVQRFRDFLTPEQLDMDFTRDSLVALETYLLERYEPRTNPFATDPDLDFLDGALRYVGETLIRHFGGHWELDLTGDMFHGLPLVMLDFKDVMPISPRDLVMWTVTRPAPVLSQVFDGQILNLAQDTDGETARLACEGSGSSLKASPPQPSAWDAGVKERVEAWRSQQGDPELDFSPDSLPALARVVGQTLTSVEDFDANEDFALGAVAYLGEVMRREACGVWVFGSGERDAELDPYAGVPYVTRDEGTSRVSGLAYWGIYDFAAGDKESIHREYHSYVKH